MSERPRFDPTVNLGHLISFGGVIVTMVGGWYVSSSDTPHLPSNFIVRGCRDAC